MLGKQRMTYTITSPTRVADMSALDDLMSEYYGVVLAKLTAAGGPAHLTPDDLMPTFRSNLGAYLPPNGRLTLAHDSDGRLVGGCTLNQVRPDAGELKRLYVRAEASGLGLGRKLMDRQFEMARAMGWKTILINVIRGNQAMLHLSDQVGFRYMDRYPECADPVELADYFVYLSYDLG